MTLQCLLSHPKENFDFDVHLKTVVRTGAFMSSSKTEFNNPPHRNLIMSDAKNVQFEQKLIAKILNFTFFFSK